ncbi:MAG: AAA family ATPase [Candidatus Nanopelagicales bacterium]
MGIALSKELNFSQTLKLQTALEFEPAHSDREIYDILDKRPELDLVVINSDISFDVAKAIAQRYRFTRPALGVVLIRSFVDTTLLRDALQCGIREIVNEAEIAQISEACRRSLEISAGFKLTAGVSESPVRLGKTIIVFSAKGGVGKTTLSTNIAAELAYGHRKKTLLIDLDLQFGDVGVALQVNQERSISDVIGQKSIDQTLLRNIILETDAGFDIIAAPIEPSAVEKIKAEAVQQIINLASKEYDFIVLDSAPAFTDIILTGFDLAEQFVIISTPDLPSIKNLRVTLSTLRALGFPEHKNLIVINRLESSTGLSLHEVRELIGIEIDATIPGSKKLQKSLNQGVPAVLKFGSDKAVKAIKKLVEKLV